MSNHSSTERSKERSSGTTEVKTIQSVKAEQKTHRGLESLEIWGDQKSLESARVTVSEPLGDG